MNATQHREAVAVKVAPMSHRLPPKNKGWKLEASGDTGLLVCLAAGLDLPGKQAT